MIFLPIYVSHSGGYVPFTFPVDPKADADLMRRSKKLADNIVEMNKLLLKLSREAGNGA